MSENTHPSPVGNVYACPPLYFLLTEKHVKYTQHWGRYRITIWIICISNITNFRPKNQRSCFIVHLFHPSKQQTHKVNGQCRKHCGKRDNAGYQDFLFFQHIFNRLLLQGRENTGLLAKELIQKFSRIRHVAKETGMYINYITWFGQVKIKP